VEALARAHSKRAGRAFLAWLAMSTCSRAPSKFSFYDAFFRAHWVQSSTPPPLLFSLPLTLLYSPSHGSIITSSCADFPHK